MIGRFVKTMRCPWVGAAIVWGILTPLIPAAAAQVTSVITYTYDETTHTNGIGRLTSVTETEGGPVVRSATFDYDVRGNITKTVKVLDGATYTTQQTYDSANRVETVTYPETTTPEVVTNTYDPAGNLKTVTGVKASVTTTYVTDIQYDAFGKRTRMTFGNGTQTTYTYDATAFRLQQLATTGPGGPLQTLSYTYDAVGNVKTIADGVSATYNESFGYDDLHRLTSATGPYGSLAYAYNQIGNMTCNSQLGPCSATSPNYAYPPSGATSVRPHAVNQAGPNTYTYDANGNMTGGAGRALTYDVNNRPTTITAGGVTATMAYDYTGERVKKAVAGGTTTTYVGSLYECSASCSKYIFAGGTRVALKAGTSVLYFHGNHLGSTHVVTDGSGLKVEEIHYSPYGATYSDTGAVGVTRKYTGQELDSETSLYYYHARYYDPVLGRFVSADIAGVRLEDPQTLNRYSYALNNPIRFVDPNGHDAVQVDAAGNVVGWAPGGFTIAYGPRTQYAGTQYTATVNNGSVLERFSPWLAPDASQEAIAQSILGAEAYKNNVVAGLNTPGRGARSYYRPDGMLVIEVSDNSVPTLTAAQQALASPDPTPFSFLGGFAGIARGAGRGAVRATEGVGAYLFGKGPKQVQPGIRALEGNYMNDLGRIEPWKANYDQYGRVIGRTDFNAGNKAAGIPDVHHHTFEYNGRFPSGRESGSHIPGEYVP